MKIAFDVDDVITENPGFYAVITQSLLKSGHEVFIITDFDEHFREQRLKELDRYGIAYTELVITSEKLSYCKENGVQYAIDDDPEYYPFTKLSKLYLSEIG